MVAGMACNTWAGSEIKPWVQYWDSEFSGNIGAGAGHGTIRKADDSAVGFGAKINLFGVRSNLSYIPVEYSTAIDASAAFNFDGKTYNVGDSLNMKFKWDTIDWSRGFFKIGNSKKTNIRFLGGIQIIDAEVDIAGTTAGGLAVTPTNFDETIPLPYIGATGDVKVSDRFRLESTLKMLELDIDDNDLSYLDFEIGLRFNRKKDDASKGTFFVGYKKKTLDVAIDKGSVDEAKFDVDMDGLFVQYRFKF